MSNVYDTANQLAKDLQESQQFQDLKKAYELLKLDAVAYALFKQFQDKQRELQQAQMMGQEITQEMVQPLQDLGAKMQDIEPIKSLMMKEQALAGMMDELNQIFSEPIAAIYRSEENK